MLMAVIQRFEIENGRFKKDHSLNSVMGNTAGMTLNGDITNLLQFPWICDSTGFCASDLRQDINVVCEL